MTRSMVVFCLWQYFVLGTKYQVLRTLDSRAGIGRTKYLVTSTEYRVRPGSKPVLSGTMPADDNSDAPGAGTPGRRGCRSAWWRCPRVPASPARRAGPPRPRADAWRTNA